MLTEHISSKIYVYVAVRQVICACSVVRNAVGSNHFKINTKKYLKLNRALRLLFNFQSSDYSAATVVKICLYSTFTRSTVSFDYV